MEENAGMDGVDLATVGFALEGTVKAAGSKEFILSDDCTFDTAGTCAVVSAFAELDIQEDNTERYEDDDDGAGATPPEIVAPDEAWEPTPLTDSLAACCSSSLILSPSFRSMLNNSSMTRIASCLTS